MKRLCAIAAAALMLFGLVVLLTGCEEDLYKDVPDPIATIRFTDGSVMKAELFLKEAPNTVSNFVLLANSGFYDGMTIHKVIPGVLIQTGDPTGTGTGNAGFTIKGEFLNNKYLNNVSHTRGTLSMARLDSDNDSASSQFFITCNSFPVYDGDYAAFGRLIDDESLEVLDTIASSPVDSSSAPLVKYVIESIRVETYGYTYKATRDEQ